MHRLVVIVLLLLIISSQKLSGQVDSLKIKVFSGTVMDDSLGTILPFTHIWNESTRQSSFSDDSGTFQVKIKGQDTLVFTTLGYMSEVVVVSKSTLNQHVQIRLKQKIYELGEVVVRRFRSYESFKYQVLNLDLPENGTEQAKEFIQLTSVAVAIETDRERAVQDKIETGRFGYTTPLGKGIDREKAFKEKIAKLKQREKVIAAKFNRELVGDLTQLEGEELTRFIAFCNFSEDYLYETNLIAIADSIYAMFNDFQSMKDTVPSFN
jgi:hypothetical protein